MIAFVDDLLFLIIQSAERTSEVKYNLYNTIILKGIYLFTGMNTLFMITKKGGNCYDKTFFIKQYS